MQVISGLKQHQNVVRLLAYCNEDNEQILVYEYMHRRSLDAYIFGMQLLTKCRQPARKDCISSDGSLQLLVKQIPSPCLNVPCAILETDRKT